MKKLLVPAVALLVVGGAVWLLSGDSPQSPKNKVASAVKAALDESGVSSLVSSSTPATIDLPADTLGFVSLRANNWSTAKNNLFNFYKRVRSLRVVEQNFAEMLPEVDSKMEQQSLASLLISLGVKDSPVPAEVASALEQVKPLLDDVVNADLFVLKRTSQQLFPVTGIRFEMGSASSAAELEKLANENLKDMVTAIDSSVETNLLSVSAADSTVLMALGSFSITDFNEGERLASLPEWKSTLGDFGSNNDAVLTFLRGRELVTFLQSALPADKQKEFAPAVDAYKEFELLTGAISFAGSQGTRYCMAYTPGSASAKLVAARTTAPSGKGSSLPKYINAQTILGFHQSTSGISEFLGNLTTQAQSLSEGNGEDFVSVLQGVKDMIEELNVSSVDLVVRSPQFGMTPEAAVLVHAQDGNSTRLDQALNSNLSWLAQNLGGDEAKNPVNPSSFQTASGKKVTQFSLNAERQAYMGPIDDTTVAIGLAPSQLESLETEARKGSAPSTLGDLSETKSVISNPALSQLVYVNSKPLIDMVRPLLGLLTGQLATAQPMSPEDIGEVLSLLTFSFAGWQIQMDGPEDMQCYQHASTFKGA